MNRDSKYTTTTQVPKVDPCLNQYKTQMTELVGNYGYYAFRPDLAADLHSSALDKYIDCKLNSTQSITPDLTLKSNNTNECNTNIATVAIATGCTVAGIAGAAYVGKRIYEKSPSVQNLVKNNPISKVARGTYSSLSNLARRYSNSGIDSTCNLRDNTRATTANPSHKEGFCVRVRVCEESGRGGILHI